MAVSLKPCPQCRRPMDARLAVCEDCFRHNSGQTILNPPPDHTVTMQGQAPPQAQYQQPPPGPQQIHIRTGNPLLGGMGTGMGLGIGCCILFPLSILLLMGLGMHGCATVLSGASAPAGTPLPKPPARMGTERPGPSLAEADANLNNPNATTAQRDAYWQQIKGSAVTWAGDVFDATTNPPMLRLRCNPRNSGADTFIAMEEAEASKIPKLRKGQYVTVNAILQEHDWSGYTLAAGRILR